MLELCYLVYMQNHRQLTDQELAAAKHNFAEAKASLACEGIYLTAEEEALFKTFEAERLPHDERRRQLIAYSRAQRAKKAHAAE